MWEWDSAQVWGRNCQPVALLQISCSRLICWLRNCRRICLVVPCLFGMLLARPQPQPLPPPGVLPAIQPQIFYSVKAGSKIWLWTSTGKMHIRVENIIYCKNLLAMHYVCWFTATSSHKSQHQASHRVAALPHPHDASTTAPPYTQAEQCLKTFKDSRCGLTIGAWTERASNDVVQTFELLQMHDRLWGVQEPGANDRSNDCAGCGGNVQCFECFIREWLSPKVCLLQQAGRSMLTLSCMRSCTATYIECTVREDFPPQPRFFNQQALLNAPLANDCMIMPSATHSASVANSTIEFLFYGRASRLCDRPWLG